MASEGRATPVGHNRKKDKERKEKKIKIIKKIKKKIMSAPAIPRKMASVNWIFTSIIFDEN